MRNWIKKYRALANFVESCSLSVIYNLEWHSYSIFYRQCRGEKLNFRNTKCIAWFVELSIISNLQLGMTCIPVNSIHAATWFFFSFSLFMKDILHINLSIMTHCIIFLCQNLVSSSDINFFYSSLSFALSGFWVFFIAIILFLDKANLLGHGSSESVTRHVCELTCYLQKDTYIPWHQLFW